MFTCVQRISVFTLAITGLFAQTNAPTEETRTSGVVGIAWGETARFNVLRPNASATAACSALLTYYDSNGATLKSSTVSVAPGAAAYLDLFSDADLSLPTDQRKQIRAAFSVPRMTPSSTAASAKERPVCRLIATLEIFDAVTGRTKVVLGGMRHVDSETTTPPPANP